MRTSRLRLNAAVTPCGVVVGGQQLREGLPQIGAQQARRRAARGARTAAEQRAASVSS
jgi:hypothetical protein